MSKKEICFPSFKEHEKQQLLFVAFNTTSEERFEWLCEMWEIMKDNYPRRDILTEEEKAIWTPIK